MQETYMAITPHVHIILGSFCVLFLLACVPILLLPPPSSFFLLLLSFSLVCCSLRGNSITRVDTQELKERFQALRQLDLKHNPVDSSDAMALQLAPFSVIL